MKQSKRISLLCLMGLLGAGAAQVSEAQHLFLVSTAVQGLINDPITFNIVSEGPLGSAVSWGTIASLSDPLHMTYNSNYQASGLPYRTYQPFFDTDFTDISSLGNGVISFNFLNTTPGANFGDNGFVVLAEFQVLLSSATPINTLLAVGLSPLGIPPAGSAVQDDNGNNLLLPTDPTRPQDNVSTAFIRVTGGNLRPLSWSIGPAVDVPEPGAVLALTLGVVGGMGLLRRRRVWLPPFFAGVLLIYFP